MNFTSGNFFNLILLLLCINAKAEENSVQFEYSQQLIFVPVQVNESEELLFLLDTGANASAIDIKTADKLDLKADAIINVEGTAGTVTVPSVRVNSLKFCNRIVNNLTLTSYDLSSSLAPQGKQIAGILGTDFLNNFVINIDFSMKIISVTDSVENYFPTVLEFEMDNAIPRFKAKINQEINTWLRYDSGSSLFDSDKIYLNSTQTVLAGLKDLNPEISPHTVFSASGVGGKIELPVYKAELVIVGNLQINCPYLIIQPQQGYFARSDAVGFFGNNLVEKFQKISIDFPERKMHIFNNLPFSRK